MTILDHTPGTATIVPVLPELPEPADWDMIAPLLPEQEWCEDCVSGETCDPGMPRDVIGRSLEETATLPGGRGGGLQFEFTWLSCGHAISWRA